MMKVTVVFWPPFIQMRVTAGIFLASILLKDMRYLVYIRYLWFIQEIVRDVLWQSLRRWGGGGGGVRFQVTW